MVKRKHGSGAGELDSELTPELRQLKEAYDQLGSILTLEKPQPTVQASLKEIRAKIVTMIKNPEANPELDLPVLFFSYYSLPLLPDYATLDYSHIVDLHRVLRDIKAYDRDKSLQRPLNFLLLASPGAGKSQLIKSVIKHLSDKRVGVKVGEISFNMATLMGSKDDFGWVLDRARNVAIDGKLPLIFLDEFDSQEDYYSLLLPLLWDGSLNLRQDELRLGKSVFFLAGSRRTLPQHLSRARKITAAAPQVVDSKLVDLFSRINGTVVTLPSMRDPKKNRAPDKVVIAMHLLRHRFQRCERVPWALLSFIANVRFRYEVRSIATLINLIPMQKDERAENLEELTVDHLKRLPFEKATELKKSPLGMHLVDLGGESSLAEVWKASLKIKPAQTLRHKLMLPVDDEEKIEQPEYLLMLGKIIGEKKQSNSSDPRDGSGEASAAGDGTKTGVEAD